ncbi:MAG TPA: PH domain-containing protein [Gemmataceae bacterium]|nr:PH domain-containing protein [Gemmataceae bacterium]
MDIDSIQNAPTTQPVQRPVMKASPPQPITGLTPPQRAEAIIREVRPSAAAHPALSGPAQMLIRTVILAPLGWLLLAPLFPLKFLPFICKRYTLTNRRLMIRRGLAHPRPTHEIALTDIDDVRVEPESHNSFYRSGTLEILSQGKIALRLVGVPQPEAFRHTVLNAVRAWAPGKAPGAFVPASAKTA